jgi:hypothetical protein
VSCYASNPGVSLLLALLRVRLKRDNSELIKRAIDELYARHNAKRAFGDA